MFITFKVISKLWPYFWTWKHLTTMTRTKTSSLDVSNFANVISNNHCWNCKFHLSNMVFFTLSSGSTYSKTLNDPSTLHNSHHKRESLHGFDIGFESLDFLKCKQMYTYVCLRENKATITWFVNRFTTFIEIQ